MGEGRRRVLYLSYTGLLEPLGQSQVYRYLRELAGRHDITLITYEKPTDLENRERYESFQEEVDASGINWYPLKYHHSPTFLATLWDLIRGFCLCVWTIGRRNVEIIHTRSYVPSVLGLLCQSMFGKALVFDMRGFWADERVDAGLWEDNGRLYRVVKWLEAKFISGADVVVSLTDAGVYAINNFDHVDTSGVRFEVIPTCVDLDLFSPDSGSREDGFVLGYVGSVGTWYRFDDVLACFEILREMRPQSRFVILNRGEHDYIRDRLKQFHIEESAISIKGVDHSEVPEEMNRMDAGIFFYTPTFSKRGTSPTKLGEFLACGIPCLCNSHVGDVERVLEGNNVGVAIDTFEPEELESALKSLVELGENPKTAKKCRSVAESHFSLDAGVRRYDSIYRSVRVNSGE